MLLMIVYILIIIECLKKILVKIYIFLPFHTYIYVYVHTIIYQVCIYYLRYNILIFRLETIGMKYNFSK